MVREVFFMDFFIYFWGRKEGGLFFVLVFE